MTKPRLDKGGIVTNLDLAMNPAERREKLKDEYAAAIVEEAIKESDARGGDAFKVVAQHELDSGSQKIDTIRKEVERSHREMGQDWVPPRALVVDSHAPGGWRWDVDPRLREAIEEGYKCPNCLQAQSSKDNMHCEWAHGNSSTIKGCGYSWITDSVIGWQATQGMSK